MKLVELTLLGKGKCLVNKEHVASITENTISVLVKPATYVYESCTFKIGKAHKTMIADSVYEDRVDGCWINFKHGGCVGVQHSLAQLKKLIK